MNLEDEETVGRAEVWAIGGGKGGTGKSFLSANLGIFLAHQGHEVILIDADLGCANLHTWLGISYPQSTLSDFLKRRIPRIREALTDTGIPHLKLLSGAQDILEIANPKHSQKMRLIRQVLDLEADYIILDLGAGTSFNMLDFFLAADLGILAVLPEPTSIENVYRFIKSAFYRKFKRSAKEPNIKKLIETAMDQKNRLGIRTPHDLIMQVVEMDPEFGLRIQKEMNRFTPKLVVNQARSRDDIALGFSIKSSCSRYFGIEMEYPGSIEYDDAVWWAAKRRRPLLLDYPSSPASQCLIKVGTNLLERKQLGLNPFLEGVHIA